MRDILSSSSLPTAEVMRTPKPRPDLRLAESYIPGVFTWIKGIFYTSMCVFLVQYGDLSNNNNNHENNLTGKLLALRAVPIIFLYFDHIYFCSGSGIVFIDSTSISIDVLAGTIAAQLSHIDVSCTTPLCWLLSISWSVLGSTHIYFGDGLISKYIYHLLTIFFILCILTFSKGSIFIQVPIGLFFSTVPFLARSAFYLILIIIDAYTLRQPMQRERDRIGIIRYGSVLFSTSIYLVLCIVILFAVQLLKIYYSVYQNNSNSNISSQQQYNSNNYAKISNNNNNNEVVQQFNQLGKNNHTNHNNCVNPILNNYNNSNNNNLDGILLSNNPESKMSSATLSLLNDNNNNNTLIPMVPRSLLISASQRSQSISIDNLDIQEAFKLAKLQCMNGKASV